VEKLDEQIAKNREHLRHLIGICEGYYYLQSVSPKKEEMCKINWLQFVNDLPNNCRTKTGWGDCTK
jgi:hypothetical protein